MKAKNERNKRKNNWIHQPPTLKKFTPKIFTPPPEKINPPYQKKKLIPHKEIHPPLPKKIHSP